MKTNEVTNSEEYTIKSYGDGSIYLEEGWHSITELKKMIELMEKRSLELRKDMQNTVEKHES